MYYLGENTIDLTIKLIEEIEQKKKNINSDYKKLEQYSKIRNVLDNTSKLYYEERANVLNYLENYEDIKKEDYDKVLVNIKLLNTHNFYGRINDEELYSFYCDFIDLEGNDDSITTIYNYKSRKSDSSLFDIPVINETKSIIDDNEFINTYSFTLSKYKDLLELKEELDRYTKLKDLINSRHVTSNKKVAFKIEMKEIGKKIRLLRNSVEEFYELHPDIKEFIYSNIKISGKVDLNDMTLYSISYFEGIYMTKVLRQLYEDLKIKNLKSINFGNIIANCLTVKIQGICTDILDNSAIFKQSYILKVIDSIYPNFRRELTIALKNNDEERINYLKSLIIDTLYLDDSDYEYIPKKR